MIRKILMRCFLVCLSFATLVLGTLTVCGVMACSQPAFYATAVADPVDEADIEAAMKEIELLGNSLELFMQLGQEGRIPGAKPDTFEVTLTQRHVNAWLSKEMNKDSKEFRRPYIALDDDLIRFAVTVLTPVTEAVVSCDFKLAKSNGTDLTLELHAVRVGKLPLPAEVPLKLIMQTNPVLPKGFELNVAGERPTLSITAMPDGGKLQLDGLRVIDGELHLTLVRTGDAVLAEK